MIAHRRELLCRTLLAATAACAMIACREAFSAPPVPDEVGPPPLQELPRQPSPADPNNLADANAAKVYIISVRGAFGRDFSPTPLAAILEDARTLHPDFVVVKVDCDYDLASRDAKENRALGGSGKAFDTERATQLAVMLTDRGNNPVKWEKNPKMVMWIKKAVGPSSLFPWACRDIYYTSDALHGGVGNLERFCGEDIDPFAAQRGRSLQMARVKGLAEYGGYHPSIATAMCRGDFILSVSFVGGAPQYFYDLTGDMILTDGGNEENGRQDKLEDVICYRGNDVLTLNADKALMIGVSKGTANTLSELLDQLGIEGDYKILDGKSDEILVVWSREVNAAERTLVEKWREFQNTPVTGDTSDERNKVRTKRIAILNEMKPLIQRFGEAINSRTMRGPLEPAGYDTLIEQIKQQSLADNPAPSR